MKSINYTGQEMPELKHGLLLEAQRERITGVFWAQLVSPLGSFGWRCGPEPSQPFALV